MCPKGICGIYVPKRYSLVAFGQLQPALATQVTHYNSVCSLFLYLIQGVFRLIFHCAMKSIRSAHIILCSVIIKRGKENRKRQRNHRPSRPRTTPKKKKKRAYQKSRNKKPPPFEKETEKEPYRTKVTMFPQFTLIHIEFKVTNVSIHHSLPIAAKRPKKSLSTTGHQVTYDSITTFPPFSLPATPSFT